jgi:ABC-type antimicrobial peptide transport system permease subunit
MVPVYNLQTATEQVNVTLRQERFLASFSTAFGALALMLVALGLYGVLNAMVTRRTSEVGVRMALGARERDIVRLLTRDTTTMVGPGFVAGVMTAFATTRFIRSRLFGVEPTDLATTCAAILVLLLVVMGAVWLPVRRATRIDPMNALRCE